MIEKKKEELTEAELAYMEEPIKRIEFRAFMYDVLDKLQSHEEAFDREYKDTYALMQLVTEKIIKLRDDVNELKRRQDQTVCYLKQRYEADKEAAIDRDVDDTMARIKSGEIKTKPYEPRNDDR
jgi:hypothetical protein